MNGFILLAIWVIIAMTLTLVGKRFDNEILMGVGVIMILLTACVNDVY